MYVLIFLAGTCSISWLFINHCEWRLLGFPRHASETPTILISWFSMMPLCGPFPLVQDQYRPFDLLEDHHDTKLVDFDLLPQFMHSPVCSGRDVVDCDGKSTLPLSSQDAKERPREWLIVSLGYEYNGKLATLLKPRQTISCIVFGIVRIIELFGSDQESTYVHLLDDLLSNGMMRAWRLSIMLENSLILCMYCLSM